MKAAERIGWAAGLAVGALTLTAAGYGRHCYLEGYIQGRKDLLDEFEKVNRQAQRARRA